MSWQQPKKSMSEHMPLEKAKPLIIKGKTLINIPLILIGFKEVKSSAEFAKSEDDSYFIMECFKAADYPPEFDDSDPMLVSLGSYTVKNQLKSVNKVEDLPMEITISIDPSDGKSLYLA